MKKIKVMKKPIVSEAFQLTESMVTTGDLNYYPIDGYLDCSNEPRFVIKTLGDILHAKVGDYIIIGIKGEIHLCKEDIFKETYDVLCALCNGIGKVYKGTSWIHCSCNRHEESKND